MPKNKRRRTLPGIKRSQSSRRGKKSDTNFSLAEKFNIEIPEDCTTYEEKKQYLMKAIKKQDAANSVNTTVHEIGVGRWLLVLECEMKNTKGRKRVEWGKCLDKLGIRPRTAQRRMRLARHVDIDKHPAQRHLGQERLHDLIGLLRPKEGLAEILEAKGIDLDVDPKDKKALREMKKAADQLIHKLKPEPKKSDEDDDSTPEVTKTVGLVGKVASNTKSLAKATKVVIENKKLKAELKSREIKAMRGQIKIAITELKSVLADFIELSDTGIDSSPEA